MLDDVDDVPRPMVKLSARARDGARRRNRELHSERTTPLGYAILASLYAIFFYISYGLFSPDDASDQEVPAAEKPHLGDVLRERTNRKMRFAALADRERAALGRARLENTLAHAERALKSADNFQSELNEWRRWVLPLLTNEEGRQLANRPELFDAIGPYFETELVSDLNVAKAKEIVDAAITPVRDALADGNYEFTPSETLDAYLENVIAASQLAIEPLSTKRARLKHLVSAGMGIASSDTLEVALRRHEEREAASVAAAEAESRAKVREEFVSIRARDAASFERKQQEYQRQLELAKQLAAEAASHRQIRNVEAVAARQRLTAYAQSEEVRPFLLPFTTPGYEQLDGTRTSSPRPYSWKKLQASGALVDRSGFDIMLQLVSTSKDKDRPRWFPNGTYDGAHHHRDQIREMQRLLRELGPTLVEVGMLDP